MKNILYILIKKFNVDLKVLFKLIVFSLFISIIPLFFISGVFNNKINNYYEKKLNESYKQIVNQYISNINYKCDIYQSYLINISLNQNIYDLINNKRLYSNAEIFDIGKKISDQVGILIKTRNDLELRNIMVYIYDESIPIYSKKITNIKKHKVKDWYIELHNDPDNKYITYNVNNNRVQVLSLIQKLIITSEQNYGKKIGFVKLDLNTDNFFNIKNCNESSSKKDIYIIDNDGNLIWKTENNNFTYIKDNINNEILKNEEGSKCVNILGQKKRLFYQKTSSYGWTVIFLFDNYEIDRNKGEVIKAIIKCVVCLVIIMLLLTVLFSKKFSKRIGLLLNKMEKVEKGDLTITNRIEGNDEIGILDKHFNKMIYKLKELINNNYVQQLEKREAELKALQFQINPHFLYNTLEVIDSIAAINECYEICEISYKLGEMFRYSINKDSSEIVTLDQEINHIKNYIYIQKIRFKDKFEVFYNINKYSKEMKILKFILQPVIENSIIHGFKSNEKCYCIEITSFIQNNCLYIKIIDDGSGIDKEQVRKLNEYINLKDECLNTGYKKSIGIKNVNMRIKLFYGNQYGLRIESKKNLGTKVIITLPAN